MFQPHADEFLLHDENQSSLAEILTSFSYALDLTEGQPAGHSIRAAWIGTCLADAIGFSGDALSDISYAVLMKDLGCSVNAARVTDMFVGDDRQLKHDFKLIGPEADDFGAFIATKVGVGVDELTRNEAIGNLAANAPEIMAGIMESRCNRGADIARQLRFSNDVAVAISHLDEHWDGSGLPWGIAEEKIHIGARIALLSQVADVFAKAFGPEAAIREVYNRSGSWLDPDLVGAFLKLAAKDGFWKRWESEQIQQEFMAMEAVIKPIVIDEDYLDDIAVAFGQVIDAKSPFTSGHSDRVGRYTDLIATELGIGETDRRSLRRAAILHDVGKLGVSSAILEKPGKLDDEEWEEMRMHSAHTFDVLSKIGPMRDMAVIAGAHHERLDGKGYPLGLDQSMIDIQTRIITISDIFDALTADRPYREAMSIDRAMSIIESDAGVAIDPACLGALKNVLADKPVLASRT